MSVAVSVKITSKSCGIIFGPILILIDNIY